MKVAVRDGVCVYAVWKDTNCVCDVKWAPWSFWKQSYKKCKRQRWSKPEEGSPESSNNLLLQSFYEWCGSVWPAHKELQYPSPNKKTLEDPVSTLHWRSHCECIHSLQGVASRRKTEYESFHFPRNLGETALSYWSVPSSVSSWKEMWHHNWTQVWENGKR